MCYVLHLQVFPVTIKSEFELDLGFTVPGLKLISDIYILYVPLKLQTNNQMVKQC